MMKYLSFLLVAVILTSCQYNVEVRTPDGDNPPAEYSGTQESPTILNRQDNYKPLETEDREPVAKAGENSSFEKHDFAEKYKQAGSPKIAVFLNRELSDNVRIWDTDPKSDAGARAKARGEDGMWSIEESFMNPFLDNGAKMIDRSTIVRLEAVKSVPKSDFSKYYTASGKQQIGDVNNSNVIQAGIGNDIVNKVNASNSNDRVRVIEMSALKGHADIYIELLVHKNSAGLALKAMAKRVNTGQILAYDTAVYKSENATKKVAVAGENGFDFIEVKEEEEPLIKKVSKGLANKVMSKLARRL